MEMSLSSVVCFALGGAFWGQSPGWQPSAHGFLHAFCSSGGGGVVFLLRLCSVFQEVLVSFDVLLA